MEENTKLQTPVTARLSSGTLNMDRVMPTVAKKPTSARWPADSREPATIYLELFPARVEPSVHSSGTGDGPTVYLNFADRRVPQPTCSCVARPKASISTTRDTLQS